MILFGFGMMLFTGLLAVQGVSGGIADGLGLRTAKFAVGNFVPLVGKMFADSVDVIFGASLILKNAVGIFGMVTVATVCLVPLIKLLVLAFLMKAGGALIQPMGEERLASCLTQLGTHILLLFAVTLSVALIFFLTITIIVGVGSMSVMMR
jgi:stage III sporulation protein AE